MMRRVDKHIGEKLRSRRESVGMTQQQLADRVGISKHQVQKYEMGANRVSISRLWEISRALGVPVEFFFDELHNTVVSFAHAPAARARHAGAMRWVQQCAALPEEQRRQLLELARGLAKGNKGAGQLVKVKFGRRLRRHMEPESPSPE